MGVPRDQGSRIARRVRPSIPRLASRLADWRVVGNRRCAVHMRAQRRRDGDPQPVAAKASAHMFAPALLLGASA